MKVYVEVDLDNQVFVDDQEGELEKVLKRINYLLPPHGETGEVVALDSNGNRVGRARIVDE